MNDTDFLQARSEYEYEKLKKELKAERGDGSWMLPSLSERMQESDDEVRVFWNFPIKCLLINVFCKPFNSQSMICCFKL